MAHPIIDMHLASKGGRSGSDAGGGDGYRQPDAPASAMPRVTFGNADMCPQTLAAMAAVSVIGVIVLRLSGFRFVVGGAAGVLR